MQAERERGITINVGMLQFETERYPPMSSKVFGIRTELLSNIGNAIFG